MTKIGYVFYLIFIAISLVSMLLFDREFLVGELALSILFTLLLLRKLWKLEHSENGTTIKNEYVHTFQKEYENLNDLLEQKNKENIALKEKMQWLKQNKQTIECKDEILNKSNIFKLFQKYLCNPIKNSLTEANWNELTTYLEDIIPGFRCLKFGPNKLSEENYRLCILIRYGFKPTEISLILGKSKSAITKTRRMLLLKIFHINGNASDFDDKLFDIF